MDFSVASWHTRKIEYWLAQRAYTTMASPPNWAKQHDRNFALLAPPARIVFGSYTPESYTAEYKQALWTRIPAIRAWIAAHEGEHIIFLCACPDGKFCHRLLIAQLLEHWGHSQIPLPE